MFFIYLFSERSHMNPRAWMQYCTSIHTHSYSRVCLLASMSSHKLVIQLLLERIAKEEREKGGSAWWLGEKVSSSPGHPSRPTLSQFLSLEIRRSAKFCAVQERRATYFEAPKL